MCNIFQGITMPIQRKESPEAHNVNKFTTESMKWKWLTLLFAISTLVFMILSITLLATRSYEDGSMDMCGINKHEDIINEENNSVLKQLTRGEVYAVLDYLYNQSEFKLKDPRFASIDKSFVHTIELKTPPKDKVLIFRKGQGPAPPREAKVFMFRGDADPPFIGEYVVGPIPNITYAKLESNTSRVTKIPYIYRTFSSFEFQAIYRYIIPRIAEDARHVFMESYNATPWKCGDQCLRFSMTPISSAFLKEGERKAWFWFTYDIEFFTLHPVDFQFLVDMTEANPTKWKIQDIWYCNQLFGSLKEFLSNYTCGAINKTKINIPNKEEQMKTSLQFRKEASFPAKSSRPPLLYEPDGPRYRIHDNMISYLSWDLEFKVSPTRGLELFNIQFDKETIVYEMSLQEVAVMYSGYSPTARSFNYADSAGLFGTRSRGLMPSVDCPAHARFIDVELYSANEGGHNKFENAICVFEQNENIPLRRHRAYGRIGSFYAGLVTKSLIIRTIISVINYDYVIDYLLFHNGAIQTRVSLTGYLGTSFYFTPEENFGAHLNRYLNAGMHNHLFNFKVDVDIKGVHNKFESLDLEMINETDPWTGKTHFQNKYTRNVRKSESESVYRYNFSTPKYLLISNYNNRTDENVPRSYRIKLSGMSNLLLPNDYGFTRSISWAKYQTAITKRKDNEEASSSLFTMWDARHPVVYFDDFLNDNDSVLDQDLVAWITLGTYHIPQKENIPNTDTVGTQLSFFLLPYNYFDEDPSMRSRDSVRVDPVDSRKPMEGAIVERHYENNENICRPDINYPDKNLRYNSSYLFT